MTQAAASGSSVELKFHHALSQIEVKAILGEGARKGIKADPDNGVDKGHEGMIVYVKGAWIMNVAGSGTLSFNKQEDAKDNHILWNADANIKGNYGRVTSKKMELDGVAGTPSGLIVNGADATLPYSLMLIPQETKKYTFANESSTAKEGAYILVFVVLNRYMRKPIMMALCPAALFRVKITRHTCIRCSLCPLNLMTKSLDTHVCLSTSNGSPERSIPILSSSAVQIVVPGFTLLNFRRCLMPVTMS